ncbi:hypothetical protein [Bradyrhizobium sp. BWA-3-5]|jgi:hypothetical protein
MLARQRKGINGGEAFTARHTPNKEAASEEARIQRFGDGARRAQVCRFSA